MLTMFMFEPHRSAKLKIVETVKRQFSKQIMPKNVSFQLPGKRQRHCDLDYLLLETKGQIGNLATLFSFYNSLF